MGGTHWYCCSQGNMMIVVKQRSMSSNYCRGPGKFNFKYIQYRYHYEVSPMGWPSPEDDEIYVHQQMALLGREQTVATIASVRGPRTGVGADGRGACAA